LSIAVIGSWTGDISVGIGGIGEKGSEFDQQVQAEDSRFEAEVSSKNFPYYCRPEEGSKILQSPPESPGRGRKVRGLEVRRDGLLIHRAGIACAGLSGMRIWRTRGLCPGEDLILAAVYASIMDACG
jgi:hypothetical protein